MGFEPTRAEPIGLAVQRLNHSATSSLWHLRRKAQLFHSHLNQPRKKYFCQKWDSNPRPQKWTATWTQRLRPLGHPDSGLVRLKKNLALSGNRTRAARVAGEHSTTEPTMPLLERLQKTLPNQRYVLDVNQIRLRWATMKICLWHYNLFIDFALVLVLCTEPG